MAELHSFAFSLSSNRQIALNQMQEAKSPTHNLDPVLINLGGHESQIIWVHSACFKISTDALFIPPNITGIRELGKKKKGIHLL